ncbi:hypothetical protein A2U01_0101907, partial [Trifolium medium]|nr:hypothetical protein [Trifolium medium]
DYGWKNECTDCGGISYIGGYRG